MTGPTPRQAAARRSLRHFYREVDREVRRVSAASGLRLRCRRGCACCCIDGVMVLPVEAEAIRESRGGMLGSQEPGAEGACAMLSPDGACRIYDDRPYVCRAQGLPLRWIEEVDGEPGWMEKRDICSLNHPAGTPLELLPPEACWTIGPFEERLARLQAACGSRDTRRIPLRGLFGRAGSPGREDLFAGGGLE